MSRRLYTLCAIDSLPRSMTHRHHPTSSERHLFNNPLSGGFATIFMFQEKVRILPTFYSSLFVQARPASQHSLSKCCTYQLEYARLPTPHAYHFSQTKACLEVALDVLLEKPMVVSGDEAEQLIETRDKTGRLLVVAFPGSLSPQIRHAVQLLRSDELGDELGSIFTVSGISWKNWRTPNIGIWRQVSEIAGGGFFFDTGAHMLNTITDLARV